MTMSPPDQLHSLTHCKKCNQALYEPITLNCGFTLCRACLPTTPSQCLSFSCLRTHTITDTLDRSTTTLLEDILSQFNSTKEKSDYLDLFDCSICLSTLTDPITTPCGHTFCKECLIRTMTDVPTRSCPYCRRQLMGIGKINQLVSGWIDYLNHNSLYESQEEIPIIHITGAVGFPTQHCLIHITQDRLSLLKRMTMHLHHQKHYAICIFSNDTTDVYQHGLMLQIHGIEHMQDLRHSVVQGSGLFRLGIDPLQFKDGCYTGEVTRLEDMISTRNPTKPSQLITTQSTPARKISRPRPCSMRLSSSAPSHHSQSNYSSGVSCPGSVYRKTWATDFLKKPTSPPPTPTFKKQHTKLPMVYTNFEDTFHGQFCPIVYKHISESQRLMQYEWYLQQGDRDAMVWWGAHILPLTFEEKMSVLSLDSVRERMIMLIHLINK